MYRTVQIIIFWAKIVMIKFKHSASLYCNLHSYGKLFSKISLFPPKCIFFIRIFSPSFLAFCSNSWSLVLDCHRAKIDKYILMKAQRIDNTNDIIFFKMFSEHAFFRKRAVSMKYFNQYHKIKTNRVFHHVWLY